MPTRPLPRAAVAALGLTLGLTLAPTFAAAQSSIAPVPTFRDADRLGKLTRAIPAVDSVMRSFMERSRVPGIAYGIVVDGKLLHVAAHGLRDVPSKARVDTSSVFRIASMTKSFTALAILQLRDAGKLSLDTPAEQYVPQLKTLRYATSDAPRITVRHLLSHAAGFPEDNPWGDQQLSASDDDLSRMIERGIPFSNTPGVAYEYSNFGFAILGRIVVNVSGMPYARYIQQKVLRPLGMTSTTLEARDVPASRLAHGYRLQDGAWLEEAQLPDGSFGAMGGMLTSSADLSRWVGLMLSAWPPRDGAESPVLKRSSLREMQQVWRFAPGSAARLANGTLTMNGGGYAYGLRVSQNCLFNHIVAHSGGLPGFGSQMRWLPEYGVGIIALGNLTYTSWGAPIDAAYEVLAKSGGLSPRAIEPSPVLAAMQDKVTRLITNAWTQPLADSMAAMNLYLDESAPRRAAAIAKLVQNAGGNCRADGPMWAENALRGEWKISCATGALRVRITLAPTEPARVQEFGVFAAPTDYKPGPVAVCRQVG
ncbi:serine hydrolase domain-containing protein [Gemmatimonas sp.]|uniref:serine hydrolase domain-containing protein n=1 Tax=Gemmatimonas sp. TaxID=1962908 RepID=UPI003F6FDEAA